MVIPHVRIVTTSCPLLCSDKRTGKLLNCNNFAENLLHLVVTDRGHRYCTPPRFIPVLFHHNLLVQCCHYGSHQILQPPSTKHSAKPLDDGDRFSQVSVSQSPSSWLNFSICRNGYLIIFMLILNSGFLKWKGVWPSNYGITRLLSVLVLFYDPKNGSSNHLFIRLWLIN